MLLRNKYFKGFGLVEILIYLALSGILSVMILNLYSNIAKDANFWYKHINLLSNANVATAMIRSDLHYAKNFRCYNTSSIQLVNHSRSKHANLFKLTAVFEKIKKGSWHNSQNIKSDIFLIQQWKNNFSLAEAISNQKRKIRLNTSNNEKLKVGQNIMLSDCTKAEIVQISKIRRKHKPTQIIELSHGIPQNISTKLSSQYVQYAFVAKINWVAYYLVKTENNKIQTYALYRETAYHVRQKIIDNISSFEINNIVTNEGRNSSNMFELLLELKNNDETLSRKILIANQS